nr:MAG TPA: Flagella accessory protein C (FlaC) [Caudoviricetes sp.]
MEIRVNILGKVAYKGNESRSDFEKAELYPFGDGVYAVMDGENFVELRVVSGKKHSEEKGDYYECIDRCWAHGKISQAVTVIEHEERLKDYIDKRFNELQSSIENAMSSADSIHDAVGSIKSSIDKIEKDGICSGNGISEKTLLSAIEIVSKQK